MARPLLHKDCRWQVERRTTRQQAPKRSTTTRTWTESKEIDVLNRKGFTLIELMIVVVIIGILAAIAIPNFISMQDRAKEAKVKGAAHTLQLAAEDFAVRNDGIYSDTQGDIEALLPVRPVGVAGTGRLQNAFTGAYEEPTFAGAAATPGEVGIVAIQDATNTNVGYTINGWGKENEILVLSSGQ